MRPLLSPGCSRVPMRRKSESLPMTSVMGHSYCRSVAGCRFAMRVRHTHWRKEVAQERSYLCVEKMSRRIFKFGSAVMWRHASPGNCWEFALGWFASNSIGRWTMKTAFKVSLVGALGFLAGASAMQVLHAQAVSAPAYLVANIESVNDAATFAQYREA